jgi:hypothetical protein
MSLFTEIKESADGRELSLKWYQARVRALGKLKAGMVIREGKADAMAQSRPQFGMLNLFNYRPMAPTRIPYYDVFPLVLPVRRLKTGFAGLNFHYLPIPMRVKLLELITAGYGDETAQTAKVTWDKVKALRYVAPTIRQYNKKKVGSLFLRIPLDDMLIGLLLPVQQFYSGEYNKRKKVHNNKVYKGSREKINYGT